MPIEARRRYTKHQKLSAVMAAEMGGVTVASEQTGIPKTTIHYWLQQPEFEQVRTRTRDNLAEEIQAVAHLAWQRTAEALRDGTIEPRDILFAAEKATNLMLLIRGEATSRYERRELTEELDDHELATLRDIIHGATADHPAETAVGHPGEERATSS